MTRAVARVGRSLLLPVLLLITWQAWGIAMRNPRTPVPTRVAQAAYDLVA